MKEMIEKGHVYDMDPEKEEAKPVTMNTPLVQAFFDNSRVQWSQLNQ